jgi:hypothetical protein
MLFSGHNMATLPRGQTTASTNRRGPLCDSVEGRHACQPALMHLSVYGAAHALARRLSRREISGTGASDWGRVRRAVWRPAPHGRVA